MTLPEAAQQFPDAARRMDSKFFTRVDQQRAFKLCLDFFSHMKKIKGQNEQHTSYGYKHIIENPSNAGTVILADCCTNCYCYEGTFILAALVCGFTPSFTSHAGMSCTFNISERSLTLWHREKTGWVNAAERQRRERRKVREWLDVQTARHLT